AADGDQSYISYDDGQTVVRQAYDGREVDAHVNLPIFAGDQIVTGRRGRTEIRLADGSIIAIDRESALEITSLGNTFESQDEQSVASLRRGAAIVHMESEDDAALRLDTPVASYASLSAGIYSVEVDRGYDQVTVLSGATEVRTQSRSYRLRAGETARVSADGIYDIQSVSSSESSFERWYLNRVDRYQGRRARYLDSRYSWVEADLADHGDWVYVGEFGWVWRPYVVAGWRPYYHGSWIHGPYGHLIWSSYEPWGWYPYHYGRWTYSGIYGWVWLPGYRYSPAWVYWAYGPSWVGWAPSGWYDCYRPYNWIWNGYGYGSGRIVDVGFFGRVNLVGSDLSGWTILESGTIVSTRVDRAALSLDAARARMARDGGHGIFSSSPVRFTRDDLKNPAAAVGRVSRLGVGGGTGKEGSGSLTDLTSFFRRDPELSPAVRSALDRSKMSDAARRMTVPTPSPDRSTSLTPSRGLGRAAERVGGGEVQRSTGGSVERATGGRVDRGGSSSAQPRQGTIIRSTPSGQTPSPSGRVERGTGDSPRSETPRGRVITRDPGDGAVRRALPAETPKAPESTPRNDQDQSWRGRVV
ncbi:MAG TPA: FecR family protein, partial [Thermoanaerobaculia bacterium]